jgi:hypothetical protein
MDPNPNKQAIGAQPWPYSTCPNPSSEKESHVFLASGFVSDAHKSGPAATVMPSPRASNLCEGKAQAMFSYNYGSQVAASTDEQPFTQAAARSGALDGKDFCEFGEVDTSLTDFDILEDEVLPNFNLSDLNVESISSGNSSCSESLMMPMPSTSHSRVKEFAADVLDLGPVSPYVCMRMHPARPGGAMGQLNGYIIAEQAHDPASPEVSQAHPAFRRAAITDKGTKPAIQKWKKRDTQKHLAGERKRRANRMGKLSALSSLLPNTMGSRPTVNHILSCAVERIKQIMQTSELLTKNKCVLRWNLHACPALLSRFARAYSAYLMSFFVQIGSWHIPGGPLQQPFVALGNSRCARQV